CVVSTRLLLGKVKRNGQTQWRGEQRKTVAVAQTQYPRRVAEQRILLVEYSNQHISIQKDLHLRVARYSSFKALRRRGVRWYSTSPSASIFTQSEMGNSSMLSYDLCASCR